MDADDGGVPAAAKLTGEQEARLVARLHDVSMSHKQETLRLLEARIYPTMPSKRIPKEAIEGSVMRQVDQEMMKRQAAREEREKRIQEEMKPLKVPSETVERSTCRLYTESIQRKKANLEEIKKRHLYAGPPMVQKKFSEIREYVTRLAVPKKREFTIDEINKIYGLAAEPVNAMGVSGGADAAGGEAHNES
ncbi:hypothetical protein C3747_63g141 [Trypanosoma cruzi]|uniref:Uncharacterized protein n=2 Tax=Trypanosoma cruzi TaxID=5693 RepID=Q4CZX0_TRYCC|nr:hypothetical protein, conserved [Trypanosoma cruzi]EAN85823.1 hypothetical protein, conserved [Trypanosoma cruzi]PWV11090.1 hypothetical protein C3747_63g141 [Trypanosoma cruzi]RNC46954.1 hypothetical protein TcCL_NonESM03215 [Trypanosoma cruzi]|eukprot:XP_807674.1 hypothetical protein [Trypanosoma cruzi strain CL Brener]